MRLGDLPLIERVFEFGPEDRIFDSLLLFGPLIIILITVVGRTTATIGIALSYIAVFVLYVLYQGAR